MKALFSILFFIVVQITFGQTNQYGKKIAYRFEHNFNANLYTRGMGLGYSYGKIKGIYKTKYNNIELSYYKDAKEKRTLSYYGAQRAFIYGKANSFYNLKLSRSWAKVLFFKSEDKGVRINFTRKLGVNMGVLKPYYIYVFGSETVIEAVRFEDNPSSFLTPSQIHSGAEWSTGLLESLIVPGATCEAGLNFDFGEFTDLVRILELGITLDVYHRPVSVMVASEPTYYFVTLYSRFNFGWRGI